MNTAVIWDFSGTIVDPVYIKMQFNSAVNGLSNKYGYDLSSYKYDLNDTDSKNYFYGNLQSTLKAKLYNSDSLLDIAGFREDWASVIKPEALKIKSVMVRPIGEAMDLVFQLHNSKTDQILISNLRTSDLYQQMNTARIATSYFKKIIGFENIGTRATHKKDQISSLVNTGEYDNLVLISDTTDIVHHAEDASEKSNISVFLVGDLAKRENIVSVGDKMRIFKPEFYSEIADVVLSGKEIRGIYR